MSLSHLIIPDREFRGFNPVIDNLECEGDSMFLSFRERIRRARGSRTESIPVAIREGTRFSFSRKLPELQPVLWTTDGYPLVTDEILAILRPFTGWSTYPVAVRSREGKEIR